MRIHHLIIATGLLLALPAFAQEDYDPLLDLDLLEPTPAPAAAEGADPLLEDDLLDLPLMPADDDDDPLLNLDVAPVVDVPAPPSQISMPTAAAPTAAALSDGESDGSSDGDMVGEMPAGDNDELNDATTDKPAKVKKARKTKEPKQPGQRRETNPNDKIHNLSVMLSGALLIDTGNIGITSPVLQLSVGARPKNGQLLLAGEFGWSYFASKIPVYSKSYDLDINVMTVGFKMAYWFRPLEKIGPYLSGTVALGMGLSDLSGRSDFVLNAAGHLEVGASIPVSHFCFMPHAGYWITGFSGDYLRHVSLQGPFVGLTIQFTP